MERDAEHQLAMPSVPPRSLVLSLWAETESGASGGVNFLHPASLAQPLFRWSKGFII
jgi:hypothetical protein